MSTKPLNEHLDASLELLRKYQTGEIKLVKTNRPWLDSAGGIIPRSIIGILGASFSGKTTELQSLIEDVMDVEINEDAGDYVSLAHAFEMSNFSLTLKAIKKHTGKKFKDILGSAFEKDDQEKVDKHFDTVRDGRYFVNHETGTPENIANQTEAFLIKNKNKKLCLVSLDHSALLKSKSGNKKEAIDDMVERFNDFKQVYPNFVLVVLTQANRSVLTRIKECSNEMKLRRDDVYASDTLFHISDYFYALQNAYYLGVEEYRKIRPDRYEHLADRFTDEDTNGRVSLHSEGCIFVEILKDRMADDLDFIDLYSIEIKPYDKGVEEAKAKAADKMPVFNVPTEDSVSIPNTSLEDAFGSVVDNDDVPF